MWKNIKSLFIKFADVMKKSLENNKVILESTFSISLVNSNSVISVSDNIYDLLGFTSDSFLDGIVSLKDLIHSDDADISNSLFFNKKYTDIRQFQFKTEA